MFCPTRILVPVDFSDASRAAYEYACGVGRAFGSEVDLLHVVSSPFSQAWSPLASLGDVGDTSRVWYHDALGELRDFAIDAGCCAKRTVLNVRPGVPARTIVEFAVEHGCDLIVMGAHESLGVADIMRGNTTERVLRVARCPVVAVPAGNRLEKRQGVSVNPVATVAAR